MNIKTFVKRVEEATWARAVREGLVAMIPILIIGAFALILQTFPALSYQNFITDFAGGFLLTVFQFVYNATFGVLSLYMTISISRAYMHIKSDKDSVHAGATFASVLSFFIVSGSYLSDFSIDNLGPKSMFLAIVTGFGASSLYLTFNRFFRSHRRTLYSPGANRDFNRMLSTLFPVALTGIIFAVANAIVISIFDVDSIRELLSKMFNSMFKNIGNDFFRGFLFVLLSSMLWFFGIHGSDTLEGVMQAYFPSISGGGAAEVILKKEFFDCFVLMGGCGATICLLIALLIFSRNRARRNLGFTAAFPMLFNINELMVFGLPVIFNPIMLIPFLSVPLVCYSVAYFATNSGMVPMITHAVEWTTPVILGGLRATGSAAGALLQVVNILIGVAIYAPFVRLLDRSTAKANKERFASFVDFFKKNEDKMSLNFTELRDTNGEVAKELCAEIDNMIEKRRIVLAYQPQFDYKGECVGVEALLRMKHPTFGTLYPPLVIKLANESGSLGSLEERVLQKMIEDRPRILKKFGENVSVSFNITAGTVISAAFMQFCRNLEADGQIKGKNLCLEVTEQMSLSFNDDTRAALNELKRMGFILAIDDFSMGQTSLNYLKDSIFDVIKLDGSLVRGLFTHDNCVEIISSIVQLASSLDLTVIAEYVETEKERDTLHEIGCNNYQGYLYSAPVFLE